MCFFIFMFVFGDKDRDYIIIDIPLCVIFRIMCLFSFYVCCFGFYDNIRDSFMEISISMMIFIFMCLSLALCDNGFIYYH